MNSFDAMLAEWDTPEERVRQAQQLAEYNAQPCRYGRWDRECYVHGYLPRRPCGHCCTDVPCAICNRPLTGRQRTRRRWGRRGRR
jgi:hypothetical protein